MTERHVVPMLTAALAVCLCLATGCGDGTVEPPAPPTPVPTTITISPAAATLQSLGEMTQLTAEVRDQNGQSMANAAVTWTSSAPSVATIVASGLVMAVANGTATVTATAGSASGTATVTVDQVVASVAVDPPADTLLAFGDTLRLSAAALDANGNTVAGAEFAWASGDTLVAVVDQQGLVTGGAAGEVEVTATSADITGHAQLAILVPTPVTVAIEPDTVGLNALGQTVRLAAEVRDRAGRAMEGVAVSWSSGDTLIATVDSSGLVTAAGNGTTTVAAEADSASGQAAVTVMQSAGSVVLSPATDTIAPGDTLRLAASAFDGNGHVIDATEFDWSSSDVSVARVDASGLVTAVSEGRTTVTAVAGDVQGTAEIRVENLDRAALVALYHATNGPNWVNSENWLTDAPLGEWYGVRTDAPGSGRVTGLFLHGRFVRDSGGWVSHGLSGALPSEIGNLNELLELELHSNDLSGRIPPELGKLTKLQHLSLHHNLLSGPIPPEFGDLAELAVLSVSQNELSGPIPKQFGNLTKLAVMDFRKNKLVGPIPEGLGNLVHLQRLDLSTNRLSGPIPPALGTLAKITSLHLSWNQLSGPIPHELGNLADLRYLTLDGNGLSGPIPPQLGNLPHLQLLGLSGNDLSGPIPPELGNLAKLDALWLNDNNLSGPLPASVVNMPLSRFSWDCGLGGVCMPGLSSFIGWLKGMDNYTGPFCNALDVEALTNLFNLAGGPSWRESRGWLTGAALEDWHGVQVDSLGRVTALVLSDNGLTGTLTGDVERLEQLRTLHISGNPLTGRLPLSLTRTPLREFHYNNTRLCAPPDGGFQSWLQGLVSHQGTGVHCGPLSDRDALSALYQASGGPGWQSRANWLSDAPLKDWGGVQVDDQGRVVELRLRGNDLSGTIPPELGSLSNLHALDLAANKLSGAIPPELGNLPNLRHLDLGVNRLSGLIPSELGELPNLQYLNLVYNNLSGTIPPEIGSLASLSSLRLAKNELSGVIPPEIGNLPNLRHLELGANRLSGVIPSELGELPNLRSLNLAYNRLSGTIPPELGSLANLHYLYLDQNELSGFIPRELGNLSELWELHLNDNSLSGRIPPELGDAIGLEILRLDDNDLSGQLPPEFERLASLVELTLGNNSKLTGALPTTFTNLGRLTLLHAAGTGLCAPQEQPFLTWLEGVGEQWVAICVDGRTMAYLTQAVQSRTHPVPLVAGEAALLRIFVVARRATDQGRPSVRARFFVNGTERHVTDIPPTGGPLLTTVEEGDLAASANAEIPGHVVRPGLELVVEIDPEGMLDPGLGVPKRIPETGRMPVDVREMPRLHLNLVPFLWSADPDSAIVQITAGIADDPEAHEMLGATRLLLPVGNIDVSTREPVWSTSNSAGDLFDQTEAIRVLQGGRGHWMGMMSGAVKGAAGLAVVGGRSSFSVTAPEVIAHELGHNMSLRHAPCGAAGSLDPWFPEPDGSIGAWGYDASRGYLVPPTRADLMSYCDPSWIGAYHFSSALRHRLSAGGRTGSARVSAPIQSLLVWGGIDVNGNPFLNPAFVADAPSALPDSAGDHSVTGRDASGGKLFQLSFTMPEVADGDGGSSFAFALPVRPEWASVLSTITLSGPDSSVTLDGDTDRPMAILRDPRNGQVRAFLRDTEDPAKIQADGLFQVAPQQGLEVLFSRGIPDAVAWRR